MISVRRKLASQSRRGARATARDVVHELHGSLIAPVQVFGDEHERMVLRVAVQELAHLPQHARLAGSRELAPQSLPFGSSGKPRKLQQPGRSDCTNELGERRVAAAQRRERLEDGQVRLAGAVLLDTLSMGAMRLAGFGHEVLDERGLSHPGLAGDPGDLAPARGGELPCRAQPLERAGAADDGRPCRRCHAAERRRRAERRDEAIPAPRYRFDVARPFGVVDQRCAQFADGRLEDRLADEAMAPDAIEQRVLRDERSRRARQRAQHGKRLGRERHRLPGARQARVGFVEVERAEAQPKRLLRLRAGGITRCHP